jgi:hypothetical protein
MDLSELLTQPEVTVTATIYTMLVQLFSFGADGLDKIPHSSEFQYCT